MRLRELIIGLFAFFLSVTQVWAGERPFDKAAFDQALAEGKPVVLVFHADWCPVCKAQMPIARSILEEPAMKNVTLFVADYDTEKELKKSLRVTRQSTFIAFKNGKEAARSTGETQREALAALFSKAL